MTRERPVLITGTRTTHPRPANTDVLSPQLLKVSACGLLTAEPTTGEARHLFGGPPICRSRGHRSGRATFRNLAVDPQDRPAPHKAQHPQAKFYPNPRRSASRHRRKTARWSGPNRKRSSDSLPRCVLGKLAFDHLFPSSPRAGPASGSSFHIDPVSTSPQPASAKLQPTDLRSR